MKVQEYVLKEEFTWELGPQDKRSLPAGTFVKPVELRYVPQHVKDVWKNRYHSDTPEIYVFTHYGFVVVPEAIVRRID